MRTKRTRPRRALSLWPLLAALLAFGAMVFWPAGASAVEPTSHIYITKSITDAYVMAGDTIHYKYVVTANDRIDGSTISIVDDKCSPVTPTLSGGHNIGDTADFGYLNGFLGEAWVYTCTATAPAAPLTPSTELTDTATVTGNIAYSPFTQLTDQDSFTLKALVLRKAVFIFWNYNTGIVDPDAADVVFKVDVKNGSTTVGTEDLTVNNPLYFWLPPGTWTLQEQTPPTGYQIFDSRGTWTTDLTGYLDNTLIDRSDYDLAIEKTGPEWRYGGDSVTYTYTVTNTGPAAVTPVVTDDTCSPVDYVSGDTNTDTLIQSTETWTFNCTMTPDWDAIFNAGSPWALTNTGTVVADEADDLQPANPGGPIFGGDTNPANDTDSYTLYAFVLRKDVGLPNDSGYPDFNGFSDNTPFSVQMYLGNTPKTTFTISESSPKYLWLSAGTWKFTEFNLLAGYVPFYPGGTITATVPDGYPDWTELNLAPWSGCSLGYWKNHTGVWPSPYSALWTTIGLYFTPSNFGATPFGQALAFPGGSGVSGGQQILLRQAVAALLNEAHYGTSFGPYTSQAALIAAVNAALVTGNRTTMTNLASALDTVNNGVCR